VECHWDEPDTAEFSFVNIPVSKYVLTLNITSTIRVVTSPEASLVC
jgi:hypothetical protein